MYPSSKPTIQAAVPGHQQRLEHGRADLTAQPAHSALGSRQIHNEASDDTIADSQIAGLSRDVDLHTRTGKLYSQRGDAVPGH